MKIFVELKVLPMTVINNNKSLIKTIQIAFYVYLRMSSRKKTLQIMNPEISNQEVTKFAIKVET